MRHTTGRLNPGMAGLTLAAALLASAPLGAQEEAPPALVVTAPVTSGPVSEEITLVGTAGPLIDSLIASEIDGRVVQRLAENGDAVRKGETLVRLDRARLERDLEVAAGERVEVRARLEQARRQEARAHDLHESDVLADRFLDEAMADRRALDGRLDQVQARIASIKDDLIRSAIKAPFDGIVTELHTEVGEWLRRGDPVVRLADFDTIEISLDVPERYYPHVSAGDTAPATLDALPDLILDGSVFAVVPRAGSAARTFPVLVRAPNPGQQVGAGMLARVRLVLSSSREVLQVPKDAIVRQAQGQAVFLLEGDVVQMISVSTGRTSGTHVEVAGKLKPGDRVVVRGNERLQPGQKVMLGTGDSAKAGGNR